ncbi:MAG: prolyl oligopeptidase family serine peptidase [Candidatus Aenigmatarchaeota archaeon]
MKNFIFESKEKILKKVNPFSVWKKVFSERPLEEICFTHVSHGRKLRGYICKPKDLEKCPLLPFDVGFLFRPWEIPLLTGAFAKMGYAVLGTEYKKEVMKSEVEDITSAIKTARKFPFYDGKIILAGISMGASAMLKIAAEKNEIKKEIKYVIAMAPFANIAYMYLYAKEYARLYDDWRAKLLAGYLEHARGLHPFTHEKESRIRSPINYVHKIECPVLFIHGKKDKIVPVDESISLYKEMISAGKTAELKIVSGEGIHTPFPVNNDFMSLTTKENITALFECIKNAKGFVQTIYYALSLLYSIAEK